MDGEAAASFTGDSGTAIPVSNNLDVLGQTGFLETTGAGDTLTVSLTENMETTSVHGWNGSIIETASVTITSNGTTITCSVEQSGGGDLTVVFSDGFYAWDTTPADTVTLTAGSDSSPQINYVYFLQSTKTLTASTTGFPSAEYAAIAEVLCQSASSLQTQGAYKVHAYTDHVIGTNDNGHIQHLNYWIRQQPATWESGVSQTYNITTNVGTPDNVLLTTSAGSVLQLHPHTFPAFGPTPDYYVVNDSVTPYTVVTDLNALLTDASGGSLTGRYFSLVIWGVVNESTGDCKLMVNLPTGSYNSSAGVIEDAQNFSVYSIPADFTGVGFLISEWKLRQQAASGGTWTSVEEIDLRGQFPSKAAGGTGTTPTEFADNTFRIYDEGDDTKKLAFEVNTVTTATTRTITMVDADLDLAEVATDFVCDSGTAVPATNVLTVVGSGGLTTSGSGSTLTISGSGPFPWNEVTGTSQSIAVNNGYVANNAGLVTFTLPATAAFGDTFKIVGKGAGGWDIDQNSGQTIHYLGSSTTTGVTGNLAADEATGTIEIVCITANTDFRAIASIGNFTLT